MTEHTRSVLHELDLLRKKRDTLYYKISALKKTDGVVRFSYTDERSIYLKNYPEVKQFLLACLQSDLDGADAEIEACVL